MLLDCRSGGRDGGMICVPAMVTVTLLELDGFNCGVLGFLIE